MRILTDITIEDIENTGRIHRVENTSGPREHQALRDPLFRRRVFNIKAIVIVIWMP